MEEPCYVFFSVRMYVYEMCKLFLRTNLVHKIAGVDAAGRGGGNGVHLPPPPIISEHVKTLYNSQHITSSHEYHHTRHNTLMTLEKYAASHITKISQLFTTLPFCRSIENPFRLRWFSSFHLKRGTVH